MANKKSYNPFKMWGSYVGAFLLMIIVTIQTNELIRRSITHSAIFTRKMFGGCDPVTGLCSDGSIIPLIWILGMIFGVGIVGFLIGWGIHSLVRKLRK